MAHTRIPTISNIRPDLARIQRLYDRPRQGSLPPICHRPKNWVLAKWTPLGWQNVARFATFCEAKREVDVMGRHGIRGAIAHADTGATLRNYELRINQLRWRQYQLAKAIPQLPELKQLLEEEIQEQILLAQLWGARRGLAVQGRLHHGLMCFWLATPEVV